MICFLWYNKRFTPYFENSVIYVYVETNRYFFLYFRVPLRLLLKHFGIKKIIKRHLHWDHLHCQIWQEDEKSPKLDLTANQLKLYQQMVKKKMSVLPQHQYRIHQRRYELDIYESKGERLCAQIILFHYRYLVKYYLYSLDVEISFLM